MVYFFAHESKCYIKVLYIRNKHIFAEISRNIEQFLMKIGTLTKQKVRILIIYHYIMQIKITNKNQVLKTLLIMV